MKNKYCCDDFRWRYETPSGMGLNIRVAKLIESKPSETIAFFITEGYTEESKGVKFCKIDYCPFCGEELSKLYSGQDVVNSKIEDFAQLI